MRSSRRPLEPEKRVTSVPADRPINGRRSRAMRRGLRFAFHIIGKFSVVISQEGAVSPLLLVLLIVLVLLAVGGGVWVSNLLWLLLVIALIVLVVGLFTGRTA